MTNGVPLPPYVLKYLEHVGVDPKDLSADVLKSLASLTPAEVNALRRSGDFLNGTTLSVDMIARIH
jgi:hypothetical protein